MFAHIRQHCHSASSVGQGLAEAMMFTPAAVDPPAMDAVSTTIRALIPGIESTENDMFIPYFHYFVVFL